MKPIILAALITFFAVGTAMAQSCESKAVSAEGKPLHGAAKTSFLRKFKRDACESKAVSAEGKPLQEVSVGAVQCPLLGQTRPSAHVRVTSALIPNA